MVQRKEKENYRELPLFKKSRRFPMYTKAELDVLNRFPMDHNQLQSINCVKKVFGGMVVDRYKA